MRLAKLVVVFGADVEAHPALRHVDAVQLPGLGAGLELQAEHQVLRQLEDRVAALRLLEHALGGLDALGLDQRVAGVATLGLEEAEAHRAADQDLLGKAEEAVDHAELVSHLGAAEDDDQRSLRVVANRGQLDHLLLEQEPRVAGQVVRHPLGGRVGPVGRAEGIVDVQVGEARERLGEGRVVLGLPLLEAAVLQHQDVAGPELARHRSDLIAHHPGGQFHLSAEQLAEPRRDRRHRERRIVPLRSPEVRDEHSARPSLAQELDRRQRGADPGVVGDLLAAVERDVQVGAQQDALAVQLRVSDARLRERAGRRSPQAPTVAGCSTFSASSTQRFA